MFTALLCTGLIASAFFFTPWHDLRDVKMAVAVAFALALFIVELYRSGLQPVRNKWLFILMCYLPLSTLMAPAPQIMLTGINVSNFWAWQPLFNILVFFLLVSVIASHEFSRKDFGRILACIAWSGFFASCYVIMQRFAADQFFTPVGDSARDSGPMAGFIGNPTLTAPFIAMTMPIMVYRKNWLMTIVAAIALFFTLSNIAWGAAILAGFFLLATRGKRLLIGSVAALVILAGAVGVGYASSKTFRDTFPDNQRFFHWKQILRDVKSPISQEVPNTYPLTGRGLGSFRFVYHIQHPGTEKEPNRFHQAHNDFIEWLYNTGVVGLFLLGMAIWHMFATNLSMWNLFCFGEDYTTSTLLASFVASAFCAFGTFSWQIGTICFYTAVIVGLLHNGSISTNTGDRK